MATTVEYVASDDKACKSERDCFLSENSKSDFGNEDYSMGEEPTNTGRRVRKRASYVWNYCDKLSRSSIKCKLCQKVMSFHGTANVITHLQRKHNVPGPVECDSTLESSIKSDRLSHSDRSGGHKNLPSAIWKYCTRLNKEAVRCNFCNKTLSFQGTSNLQRHLHRMHGISTFSRTSSDGVVVNVLDIKSLDTNSIWEYLTQVDDDQVKCNMCDEVFHNKDIMKIKNHLVITHSVAVASSNTTTISKNKNKYKKAKSIDDDESNMFEEDESNGTNNEPFCDDFMEEFDEANLIEEEPINPNVLNDLPYANPLSPPSSDEDTRRLPTKREVAYETKKFRKLKEERLKTETEYLREKAGYYRMLKYLTALQAKKVRAELAVMGTMQITQVEGDFSTAIESEEAS